MNVYLHVFHSMIPKQKKTEKTESLAIKFATFTSPPDAPDEEKSKTKLAALNLKLIVWVVTNLYRFRLIILH